MWKGETPPIIAFPLPYISMLQKFRKAIISRDYYSCTLRMMRVLPLPVS